MHVGAVCLVVEESVVELQPVWRGPVENRHIIATVLPDHFTVMLMLRIIGNEAVEVIVRAEDTVLQLIVLGVFLLRASNPSLVATTLNVVLLCNKQEGCRGLVDGWPCCSDGSDCSYTGKDTAKGSIGACDRCAALSHSNKRQLIQQLGSLLRL